MALQELTSWGSSMAAMLLIFCLLPIILPFFAVVALLVLVWSLAFDRLKAHYELSVTRAAMPELPDVILHTARDGVTLRILKMTALGDSADTAGESDNKVVLLCNPLGAKGFICYHSVIAAITQIYGPGTTFVVWDYRSFFESDEPNRLRNVCVRNHAEDAAEVLKAAVGEGRKADVVVGHSMGVQVALEFALIHPEKVGSMVLMNGTYGHALQTGLQPIIKLPYMGDIICAAIQWVLKNGHERRLEVVRQLAKPGIHACYPVYTRLFGSKQMQKVFGNDYLEKTWNGYLGGICSNSKTMKAFLRGFQELDAHSTRHLLYQLGHPTLLIAGLWDMLTPAYNMAVMKSCMPNARLVIDSCSGHFSGIEHPERVMGEIAHFLTKEVSTFKRMSTSKFSKVH
ncbi:unnamed protein product [Polarella glacialis]|uniref:AB hydrolase-1 domain-containing protein n=1 Tax=Polarella glacialis TaxID=89957 RepID=A0A813FG99_POLGL|nr:unnamed protein product [Polarella glacialis]